MDLNIDGKRALVTGSSSGPGAVIATTLAAEGVTVVVHGRDRNRVEAVAERITGMGGTASIAIGDLTSDRSADDVGRRGPQRWANRHSRQQRRWLRTALVGRRHIP